MNGDDHHHHHHHDDDDNAAAYGDLLQATTTTTTAAAIPVSERRAKVTDLVDVYSQAFNSMNEVVDPRVLNGFMFVLFGGISVFYGAMALSKARRETRQGHTARQYLQMLPSSSSSRRQQQQQQHGTVKSSVGAKLRVLPGKNDTGVAHLEPLY